MAQEKKNIQIRAGRKKFNPAVVLLVAIIIVAVHMGMKVIPAWSAVGEKESELRDVEKRIELLERKTLEAEQQAVNLSPTDEELLREEQIPASGDATNLLRYFEQITPYDNIAEIKKVDLKAIAITEARMSKKEMRSSLSNKLNISLTFTSSPQAFRSLLRELERSDKRIFNITDIALSESLSGPISQRGKYTITMNAYMQR